MRDDGTSMMETEKRGKEEDRKECIESEELERGKRRE